MVKSQKVNGIWRGKSAGGCLNHSTWRNNPQLFLSVERKKSVKITLTQKNNYHIGVYVAMSDESGRRQLILSKPSLVGRAGFEDEESIQLDVSLHPSNSYVVIPCTFHPGQEGEFTLTFQCSGTLKINPLVPNREWKLVTAKSEWKGKSAGGCRNFLTCINNPQFLLRTRKGTAATILLSQTTEDNFDAMGFYILYAKSSTYKLSKFRNDYFFAKSDFVRGPEVSLSIQLEAKCKYVLIPCTFEQGNESNFNISVFSENDIKIRKLKDSKEVSIKSEWSEDEAGGCINYSTWRNNPQFFLIMDKKAKISITLEQDTPILKSIGFYLVNGNGSQVVILPPEDLIAKSNFHKQRAVTVECILDKSDVPYVIIPCTFHPNISIKFIITVCVLQVKDPSASSRTRAKKILQLVPCNSEWRRKIIQGYWTEGFRGGCINEKETWLKNPQFALQISEPSKVTVILTQILPENVIGVYIIRSDSCERLIESPPSTDLIGASQFPKGSYEAFLQCDLPAGIYILVCCTFEPGKSGDFELTVYTENDNMDLDFKPIGDDISFAKQKENTLKNIGFVRWSDVQMTDNIIGIGAFGIVFKGYWKDQTIAIKKLRCDDMKEKEYVNFQMEIELMSKLKHKNILSFLGAALESTSYLITEYMERGNLSMVLKDNTNLSWDIKIRMALDAAEGIYYLHKQDPVVVHRDLKSLNLLVSLDYTVKVADFGLSKTTSGKSLNSKVGSVNWCAPEILLKRMPYTPKSDVYSFGMILFELVTHHPPFQGYNPLQVVRAIDQGELPSLPLDTREEIVQLTEDCWKDEPDDRPDFEEIVERLKQIQEIISNEQTTT